MRDVFRPRVRKCAFAAMGLLNALAFAGETTVERAQIYTTCRGDIDLISDGKCDAGAAIDNNNAECGYDGGDCCFCTCIDGTHQCGSFGYDCVDPDAECSADQGRPLSLAVVLIDVFCFAAFAVCVGWCLFYRRRGDGFDDEISDVGDEDHRRTPPRPATPRRPRDLGALEFGLSVASALSAAQTAIVTPPSHDSSSSSAFSTPQSRNAESSDSPARGPERSSSFWAGLH